MTNEKKQKKVLEKDIQRDICDWLFSEGFYFWRQNTIPVYEKGKFRALPKYTPRGLPDIICLHEGKLIGLEVKRPNYWKRTDDQEIARENFTKNGGFYNLVISLEEAQNVMSYHANKTVKIEDVDPVDASFEKLS